VFLLQISIGWIAGLRGEKGGTKYEFTRMGKRMRKREREKERI
jgi:hypothetical protein